MVSMVGKIAAFFADKLVVQRAICNITATVVWAKIQFAVWLRILLIRLLMLELTAASIDHLATFIAQATSTAAESSMALARCSAVILIRSIAPKMLIAAIVQCVPTSLVRISIVTLREPHCTLILDIGRPSKCSSLVRIHLDPHGTAWAIRMLANATYIGLA